MSAPITVAAAVGPGWGGSSACIIMNDAIEGST